jgi:hypothetical protein
LIYHGMEVWVLPSLAISSIRFSKCIVNFRSVYKSKKKEGFGLSDRILLAFLFACGT